MSEFIEKVSKPKVTKATTSDYKNIVKAVSDSPIGWYKITLDKNPNTLYQQLHKLIKDRKDLKAHKIKDDKKKDIVYLEKVAVKK